MKSKRDLSFPNVKLEKQAISAMNKWKLSMLKDKLKIMNDQIDVLYDIRYEALVWYNGCEGAIADKFFKIVEKAEKAILKLM